MNNLIQFNDNIINLDNKQLKSIAYAHGCANSNWKLLYKKAFWKYPTEYIVNDDQIKEAKKELEVRKNKELKSFKNKLVFVNMWMSFKSKKGYINNHRIRSFFLNYDNEICFLEVWSNNDNNFMRCDFAKNESKNYNNYNYNNILNDINNIKDHKIYSRDFLKYRKNILLDIINNKFNCNYKKIYFTNILNDEELKNNLI